MKFTHSVTDLGWADVLARARALAKSKPYVKVGVIGSSPRNRRPGESIDNVELALIQEFGSPKNNIPARSFIRAPFAARAREYRRQLALLLSRTLTRAGSSPEQALALMGERISADLKASMPGTPPPNAPSTKRRKEALTRRGSTGIIKTLVDTGRLLQSITYAVVRGGE